MNYDVVYLAKQALILCVLLSLPVVVVGSVVGLVFSMFQALTQVQDQTLSFAIKLLAIMAILYSTVDWMAIKIYRYAILLYSNYM